MQQAESPCAKIVQVGLDPEMGTIGLALGHGGFAYRFHHFSGLNRPCGTPRTLFQRIL